MSRHNISTCNTQLTFAGRKPNHAAVQHQLARTLVAQYKQADNGTLVEKKKAPISSPSPVSPRRGTAMIAAAAAALTEPPPPTNLDEAFQLFESASGLAKDVSMCLYIN
jgi:hypothetical protein